MTTQAEGQATAEPIDESYWQLALAFPLVSIRDDAHLDAALAVIDRLTDDTDGSTGQQAYLGALADLVWVYEQAHLSWPEVRGVDVLRHLMDEHQLRPVDLAPLFGGRSVVSAVLAGKRRLTLAQITGLSARFGLPADTFIDPLPRKGP